MNVKIPMSVATIMMILPAIVSAQTDPIIADHTVNRYLPFLIIEGLVKENTRYCDGVPILLLMFLRPATCSCHPARDPEINFMGVV